jgi:hypothetical protein
MRARQWPLVAVLLVPLLPLAASFATKPSLFDDLLRWRGEEDPGAVSAGAFNALKLAYLSLRPGLDLVYAAALPTAIALVVAPAVLAVIVFAAVREAARGRLSAELLIPLLALGWIIAVPTGFAFTRIFLPSQFFMVVVLVQALQSGGAVLRGSAAVAVTALTLANLHQAAMPTYRLDSIAPYRQIADDVIDAAKANGITIVMASDNSLNVESIFRYMRDRAPSSGIRLLTVTEMDLARRAAELQGSPFIFISHMGGGGPFVAIHRLAQRTSELARGYVPLRELPYNDLWRRRYLERAGQPDAIDVWIVR